MISIQDKHHIKRSWKLVVPIAETAADLFYRRLFELKPEYRALFPEDMQAQKRKLLRMLAFVVRAIDFPDQQWKQDVPIEEDLLLVILALGRRHTDLYKIPDESYVTVGEALLWTLGYGLGEAFTEEVREAWLKVYTLLVRTMKMGSRMVDSQASLASAEVALRLGHEALIVDLAELGIDDAKLFTEEGL
ncbi:MAG: hypothetical protein RJA70_3963 [Pseudomonadota bacterium]|jgi:hemoglobin-like flavoprotein